MWQRIRVYANLYGRTRIGSRVLPGILLSAAIFSLAHANLPAIIPLLLVGIVLAYVFERTHSLLPCIVIHLLNNGIALLPLLMPEIRILKL